MQKCIFLILHDFISCVIYVLKVVVANVIQCLTVYVTLMLIIFELSSCCVLFPTLSGPI